MEQITARLLLALCLSTLSLATQAHSIPVSELPAAFSLAIASGEIEIEVYDGHIQSTADAPGVSVYSFTRNGLATSLVSYDVLAPNSYFNGTALSGQVYFEVATSYDLTMDNHPITVYFDLLSPAIGDILFLSSNPFTTVYLDGDAIAGGSGLYHNSGESDYIETGNMRFGPGVFAGDYPFICVECALDFQFNLIFLDFSSGSLLINPDDPRPNLITAIDSYAGSTPYGYNLNIQVQAVPVPAAFWLLLSAVGVVGFRYSRTPVSES